MTTVMPTLLPLIVFITLFCITFAVCAGYAVVYRLYFTGYPRRRMPSWLIVAVLAVFLVMPRLDLDYLARRSSERAEIHE